MNLSHSHRQNGKLLPYEGQQISGSLLILDLESLFSSKCLASHYQVEILHLNIDFK